MLRLHSLPYSPWSEKARWALLHHGVAFREVGYVPIFGALPLRAMTGYRGKLSVPLLDLGRGVVVDSCKIAQWSDANGSGAPLFPAHQRAEILEWNQRSESAISAARSIVVARIGDDAKALREGLPAQFPAWTRGPATPLARVGAAFIRAKWSASTPEAQAIETIWRVALQIRSARSAGRLTLLDGCTFADIAAAAVLQCVSPVDDRYIPLGPATRRLWTRPELAAEFADLLEWRDALYAAHRPPNPSSRSLP